MRRFRAVAAEIYSLAGKRVWVAGHRGMVGSALVRRLADEGCIILTAGREELDLRRQAEVEAWMTEKKPQVVFLAAAKVGGILANRDHPAEFIADNLAIALNLVQAAYGTGVEKLLFLGSSCIYPKFAAQPIREESLLSGPLETTNEAYALAKIAGIGLCQAFRRQFGCDFISVQPCNLYGPGDTFDREASHVLPALMLKAHEAKRAGVEAMTVWGTGTPLREFLHVDDLADALVFLMRRYSDELPINVGSGLEISIRDAATKVAQAVGFGGRIEFDATKPDGTPRKLLDGSRLRAMGWRPAIDLDTGLRRTYEWFLATGGARPGLL